MSFEKLLNHKCAIYHMIKNDKNLGYGINKIANVVILTNKLSYLNLDLSIFITLIFIHKCIFQILL